MTPASARRKINSGEGQKVEFKESTAETRRAIESLGAFAHANGGTVFFGVTDNRHVVGVQVGANTLEKLANEVRQQTKPPQSPELEVLTLDDRSVIAMTIEKAPPNHLVYAYDRPWIRVGKTNQVMGPDEVQKRLFRAFKLDEEPRLIFGNAVSVPGQTIQYMVKGVLRQDYRATVFRLPLTNSGGGANAVNVRLVSIEPPVAGSPSAPLHKMHDNPQDHSSYRDSLHWQRMSQRKSTSLQ